MQRQNKLNISSPIECPGNVDRVSHDVIHLIFKFGMANNLGTDDEPETGALDSTAESVYLAVRNHVK